MENIKNTALLTELKNKRSQIAMSVGLPAHKVFRNEILLAMAETKPVSEAAMMQIFGVGPTKYRMYGEPFLNIIRNF